MSTPTSTLGAATAPATPLAARRRRRRRAAALALRRGLLPPAHRGGGPLKATRGRADVVGEPRTTGSTEHREDA